MGWFSMLVLTLRSYARFQRDTHNVHHKRLAVKVHRIDEKLQRKASKLGNRVKPGLHIHSAELILQEAKNVPPGEVRPVTVFI